MLTLGVDERVAMEAAQKRLGVVVHVEAYKTKAVQRALRSVLSGSKVKVTRSFQVLRTDDVAELRDERWWGEGGRGKSCAVRTGRTQDRAGTDGPVVRRPSAADDGKPLWCCERRNGR